MVEGTTFKNVVPISTFVSYVKHHSNEEIVFDWVNGVTNIKLSTNGTPESYKYKPLVIQTQPVSQDDWSITFDSEYDASILTYFNRAHGYVWNVTKNEIVRVRSADTTSGYCSLVRGLLGTNKSTWSMSDVILLLNVIVLGPVTITDEGEWKITINNNPEPGDVFVFTYGGRTARYQFVSEVSNNNDILIGDDIGETGDHIAEKLDMDYADYTSSIVSNMGGEITIVQGEYAGYILNNASVEGDDSILTVTTIVEPTYTGSLGNGIGTVGKIPDIGIGQKLITP